MGCERVGQMKYLLAYWSNRRSPNVKYEKGIVGYRHKGVKGQFSRPLRGILAKGHELCGPTLSTVEGGLTSLIIAWLVFEYLTGYLHQIDLRSLSLTSKAIRRAVIHVCGGHWHHTTKHRTCQRHEQDWCFWCGIRLCLVGTPLYHIVE